MIEKEILDYLFSIDVTSNQIEKSPSILFLSNKKEIEKTYLYLIQLLNSTYGYKQYIKDRENKDLLKFGIFRTKICRYLYKNADKISDTLIKNCKYTKE